MVKGRRVRTATPQKNRLRSQALASFFEVKNEKCSKKEMMQLEFDITSQTDKMVSPSHRIQLPEMPRQNKPAKRKLSTETNHKLTEYFPVRRSERKTKKLVLEEKQRDLEDSVRNQVEDGLQVTNFNGKGRGVIASRPFSRGDFVVEYSGDLIDMAEANRREQDYAERQMGCYMYYFKFKMQQHCVDATVETGRIGRLINHSRNGNLITKIISVDSRPRLVLIANQDVRAGEELTYDYGDRSKESLKHHPWLAS